MTSDVPKRPTEHSALRSDMDAVGRLLMADVATVISAAATLGAVTGNIAFLVRNRGLSMLRFRAR